MGSFFLYMLFFPMSFGPIMWLYFPEVIQPNIVSLAVMANWLTNGAILIVFPTIRAACGSMVCPPVFLFLSISMVVCLAVCEIMMVETKGKTEL